LGIFASRWFRLAVSLGLLTAVVWLADWRSIWSVLREVDGRWVWCAFMLGLLDRAVLTYRWQVLLDVRGLDLRFAKLLRLQLAANLLGSFLPSSLGVDAIRIAALCRSGLPATEVVATTLLDRASIVVGTLVFGSITMLALAGTRLPANLFLSVLLATGAVVAVCLVALLPGVRKWGGASLLPWLPARIRDRVAEVARATLAYRHEPAKLLWISAVTVAIFMIRLCFAKMVVLACGADVAFMDLMLVIPILWIVMMLPITVGGIGLQEAGYVALMGVFGITPAIAVSMSIIEHVVNRAVSLPGAFFLGDVIGATSPDASP